MTAARARWKTLREGWLLIAAALVVVPAIAIVVSSYSTPSFRSSATLAFSGRNTGSLPADVIQARNAVLNDRSLAERTLSVTGVTGVDADELQQEIELSPELTEGTLEFSFTREEGDQAYALTVEYARQLARDQFARVVEPASSPVKVMPRPARDGLVALAAALPFGVMLALVHGAARRRRYGDE